MRSLETTQYFSEHKTQIKYVMRAYNYSAYVFMLGMLRHCFMTIAVSCIQKL
jgi:hypothetical protein